MGEIKATRMNPTYSRNPSEYSPSGFPPSLYLAGTHATWSINGLILNDKRRSLEQYRITEVNGLDDPELRDAREALPDRDGESALLALYGGRTITLSGQIIAGNHAKVEMMRYALKNATNTLAEFPVIISTHDFEMVAESSDVNVDAHPGMISTGWEGETLNTLAPIASVSGDFYVDYVAKKARTHAVQATFALSGNDVSRACMFGVATKVSNPGQPTSSRSQVLARIEHSGTALTASLIQYDNGIPTVMQSAPLGIPVPAYPAAKYITVQVSSDGLGQYFANFYDGDADETSDHAPILTLTRQSALNYANLTSTALYGSRASVDKVLPRVVSFKSMALDPTASVYGMARKAQSFQARDTLYENGVFRRPFVLALRFAEPRLLSRFKAQSTTKPITSINQLGRFYDKTFDYTYPVAITSEGDPGGDNNIRVVNFGNANASPTFRIYGEIVNPTITNLTTGQVMYLSGTIPSGEYWDIDTQNRTIVDSSGINRFASLSHDSQWIHLSPRANELTLAVFSFGGPAPSMSLTFRHAWI